MYYLQNPYDPNPAPSPRGEGRPAAQATAVASAVAFSPSRGSQPCRLGRLEGGLWQKPI